MASSALPGLQAHLSPRATAWGQQDTRPGSWEPGRVAAQKAGASASFSVLTNFSPAYSSPFGEALVPVQLRFLR